MQIVFTGSELQRLDTGEIVDGFKLSKKKGDAHIYGKCANEEDGSVCGHTVRLDYPAVDVPTNLTGYRTCPVCLCMLERSGPARNPDTGAIMSAPRQATGHGPASFCWCGEKPEVVVARHSGAW